MHPDRLAMILTQHCLYAEQYQRLYFILLIFLWFCLWAIDLFDGKYQIIYKHEYKHDKKINIDLNIILRNSNFKLAYIAL